MPKWTKEQLKAINEEGKNILVSAGAGSGKTAVLSERVLRKVSEGIDISRILVLTFTEAAAAEMKSRIRDKIAKTNNEEQLIKLDSAYITTFDSFALSVVRKYHYLLDIAADVSIVEKSVITLKMRKILDELFLKYYETKEPNFLRLIDTYCLKDDHEIKDFIINVIDKINLIYDQEEYINNYVKEFYSDEHLKSVKDDFINLLKSKIEIMEANLKLIKS